jgi:hypothetical protein
MVAADVLADGSGHASDGLVNPYQRTARQKQCLTPKRNFL